MSSIIHDIRNQLAIAAANVEAFHDGILVPTPERLRAVLDALEAAGVLLGELPREAAIAVRDELSS